jgi:hypothetical protein
VRLSLHTQQLFLMHIPALAQGMSLKHFMGAVVDGCIVDGIGADSG